MTDHWDDEQDEEELEYYEEIVTDLEHEIGRDLIAIEAQYQLKEFDPIAYEKVKALLLKYKAMCDA